MSMVTPGISRSSRCTASSSRRSWKLVPAGKRARANFSTWSETSAMRRTPSAAAVVAIASTLIGPSTGWPPVMATASL